MLTTWTICRLTLLWIRACSKDSSVIAVVAIQQAAFTNLTIASEIVGGGQAKILKGCIICSLFFNPMITINGALLRFYFFILIPLLADCELNGTEI